MTTRTIPLGDIVTITGGGTPDRSVSAYWGGNIPWASVKDMTSLSIERTVETITSEGVANSATNLIPSGQIIVPTRMALGKAAINAVPLAINQDLKGLKPASGRDVRFLLWFLLSKATYLEGRGKGATVKGITLDVLRELAVPDLHIDEQRRIAAILDKADSIRRKRQQALVLADEFLRSVFLDMFGDIKAKKTKFPLQSIRGLVSASSGKSSKAVICDEQTDFPIYGGNGINGWASQPLYHEPVIVVGRVGQQCGITRLTDGPAWITDNAIVIRITDPDRVNPDYLEYALQMSPLRSTVQHLDLPFINQGIILDFPLPIPPIEAQRRFSEAKKASMASSERARLVLREADILFASLSKRAFRGELGRH